MKMLSPVGRGGRGIGWKTGRPTDLQGIENQNKNTLPNVLLLFYVDPGIIILNFLQICMFSAHLIFLLEIYWLNFFRSQSLESVYEVVFKMPRIRLPPLREAVSSDL